MATTYDPYASRYRYGNTYYRRSGGGGAAWILWAVALGALVLLAFLLIPGFAAWDPFGTARDPDILSRGAPPPAAGWTNNDADILSRGTPPSTAGYASIDNILKNPSMWMGRNVVVSGSVERMIGPRTFVVENDPALGSDQMLVIARDDVQLPQGLNRAAQTLASDDVIQVGGTTRRLDVGEVEAAIGVDLDDAQILPWAGKPVILADYVDFIVRGDR